MNKQKPLDFSKSPLSLKQIQRIEQLNLPILQKHHLRLLAHCLTVFKSISPHDKSLPSKEIQLRWCLTNPDLQDDAEFIDLLISQFAVASKILEEIAKHLQVQPMDLTLDDLINEAFKE